MKSDFAYKLSVKYWIVSGKYNALHCIRIIVEPFSVIVRILLREDAYLYSEGTLSTDLRQTFTDNLLSTYKQLERSFMIKLYELQKALGFKTLWNLEDLIGSFRRIASESALGVGRLNGVVELTKELQKLSEVIDKVQVCFTKLKYTTSVHKWNFTKKYNKQVKF